MLSILYCVCDIYKEEKLIINAKNMRKEQINETFMRAKEFLAKS